MKKSKIDYEKFLDMDKHQLFLDELYNGLAAAQLAITMLEKIKYKGLSARKSIKWTRRFIKERTHDINVEEMWRGND